MRTRRATPKLSLNLMGYKVAKYRTDEPCTQAEAISRYNFDGPVVLNRFDISHRAKAGEPAGCVKEKGYRCISIKNRYVKAHRLVWFAHTGCWPTLEIDHMDGNKLNNHISNLREVDRATNAQNRGGSQKTSSTKIRNVNWSPSRKSNGARPRAIAWINGKEISLGAFDSIEECKIVAEEFMRANYIGFTERSKS